MSAFYMIGNINYKNQLKQFPGAKYYKMQFKIHLQYFYITI